MNSIPCYVYFPQLALPAVPIRRWLRWRRWRLARVQCPPILIDVLMVTAWAALIPSLLWFGHWMGV